MPPRMALPGSSSTSRKKPARRPERAGTLRKLPSVHEVLERGEVRDLCDQYGRRIVTVLLRARLEELRRLSGKPSGVGRAVDEALKSLQPWLAVRSHDLSRSSLVPVINATGVVIHTNLGRAPLPEEALRRMTEVGGSYTNLEYDLRAGRRGSRGAHLERLFRFLFPGAAALVVNNNAAALLLALDTLAEGREVIVSRGELVEIGGSFRVPEILAKSGALLREVGTTNRTRLRDYERAIGRRTGLILKVHPSNYRIVGFTSEVPLADLAALARRRRVPLVMDQGSGNLVDLRPLGVRDEPTVHEVLQARPDLVCFSGDKLLGGPQAGILLGKPALIARLRANPLSRA